MHLRIITQPTGVIDGVSLDKFRIGEVYELGTQVGCVFLAEGWAEIVAESEAAGVTRRPPPALANVRRLVLVVDDEPELRRLTESILSSHGYHVVVAAHGAEAIERLRERCPDLIVLDLNMPVMDGWRFRAEQRQLMDKTRSAIPIVLLTGESDAEKQAEKLRAVGVIKKPFDPGELLKTVAAAIPQ
jgi:CheY-like chemotaxis protein